LIIMTQLSFSSGDLVADRRADYARMLADGGDFAAAADLMRQALELVPAWPAGHFTLGVLEEKSGRLEAASEAFREVLRLAPADIYGAGLKLAALGQAQAPSQPPAAYVARLFDDYAERFDSALVEGLSYSIPEKLTALIVANAPDRFKTAIDLGCGTGLLGERLRNRVSFLKGYDISKGMLAKAAEKAVYDQLAAADLASGPANGGVPLPENEALKADLVTAADVFMYFGDLEPVFATAAAIIATNGYFAFSVEDGAADVDWQLQPSLRYRHGEHYLRALLEHHGFDIVATERGPIRKDGAETIIGLLVVARRRSAAGVTLADLPVIDASSDIASPEVLH
jgi:predicted TPR repeat methyltransferase